MQKIVQTWAKRRGTFDAMRLTRKFEQNFFLFSFNHSSQATPSNVGKYWQVLSNASIGGALPVTKYRSTRTGLTLVHAMAGLFTNAVFQLHISTLCVLVYLIFDYPKSIIHRNALQIYFLHELRGYSRIMVV